MEQCNKLQCRFPVTEFCLLHFQQRKLSGIAWQHISHLRFHGVVGTVAPIASDGVVVMIRER